MTISVPC